MAAALATISILCSMWLANGAQFSFYVAELPVMWEKETDHVKDSPYGNRTEVFGTVAPNGTGTDNSPFW